MIRRATSRRDRREAALLDEEAWDVPRRLTDDDLFTHGGGGDWRRAPVDLEDPEDFR